MDLVVDASVAMGWLVRSQATPLTLAVRNALARDIGWVPAHFGIEIARALRKLERRKLISPEIVDNAIARLRDLSLKQDAGETLDRLATVVALARRHTLRVADAAYLELALRLGRPLATRDASLARAAKEAGVPLFSA
jgi:predicted nucleic acid-binding protein